MNQENTFEPDDTAKSRQRSALLAKLRDGAVSTLYAREELGIGHPAGRIYELRRAGWPIVTRRACVADSQGRKHVVASYFLENFGGAA